MNYNNPSELDRMKELIGFRSNAKSSSTSKKTPVVEYQVKAADGKTYGIVNEGNKFYIKEAPKKDTQVLSEDFDYIGGFCNRKQNEYSSYNMAAKQLELKVKNINEAYAPKQKIELPNSVSADWQDFDTKEMRESINRLKQISHNVNYILAEDKTGMTLSHTLPEAPASNPSEKEVNAPFTDTAVANGDKDFKETKEDHTKAAPFDASVKDAEKQMTSDKAPAKGNSDETYKEDAKYVPDGAVADKKPSGGKVVRVEECKKGRTLKLTEEQVLAWSKERDYMDKSNGTEIGDTAPFTEKPVTEEADVVHNSDNQNTPTPGQSEVDDTAPFDKKVNEASFDTSDVVGFDDEEDVELEPDAEDLDADVVVDDNDDIQDELEFTSADDSEPDDIDLQSIDDPIDLDFEVDDWDDDYVNPDLGFGDFAYESKNRKGKSVNETKLDDFGKHPAYRKKPMTTPPNTEVAPNGARDWNDDSAKGDAPYGKQIGSSAPFDEKVIDLLTDAVMRNLGLSKK